MSIESFEGLTENIRSSIHLILTGRDGEGEASRVGQNVAFSFQE